MGAQTVGKSWDLILASYHKCSCDNVGGRSGSSCVRVRTLQGVLRIPLSSGPSSEEAGNAHEFFSFVLSRALPVAFRHAATASSTAFFPGEHLKYAFLFCVGT